MDRLRDPVPRRRTAFPTPAPVAWLCDAGRLGTRKGKPGEFDNRYYIEDSLMPGSKFLKAQGITKVVYVTSTQDTPNADINVYLREYQNDGLQVSLFCSIRSTGTSTFVSMPRKPSRFVKSLRSQIVTSSLIMSVRRLVV